MTTWFEDLGEGWESEVGRVTVSEAEAIEFARTWDPQPFHVDPSAASASIYGRLTLSSLHLFALCTRLFFDHSARIRVMAMLGKDAIRFPNPAYPDEELCYRTRCAEARASSSKPDRGIVTLEDLVSAPGGRAVMSQRVTLMVATRPRV